MGFEVINGDCIEVMRGMDDDSVDVVVTDPPYGIGFEYLEYEDTKEGLVELISDFLPEAIRVAKKRVVVFSGPTQICLYPSPDWVGCVTWNTTGSRGKYGFSQWTPVLFYGKDRKGFNTTDGILKSDTIHISGGGGVGFNRSKEEKKHTCPKPMTIMEPIILRHSLSGETILDPFCGSGSTGVACVSNGRSFIGIEMTNEYANIARQRIGDAQGVA